MLKELQQQYDALEEARLTLIRKVRDLDPQVLEHKPGGGPQGLDSLNQRIRCVSSEY